MSVFSDVVERIRTLVFRRREERELEEELRFHVNMETEQNQKRGLNVGEAHRQSMMALGGIEQTKENVRDARGTRMIEESVGDFARAVRGLRKSPGFSTVTILTLAIGIGGTTAVYSTVDSVLLKPLPYQEPGQLVRLYQHTVTSKTKGFVTPVHFLDYRARLASLEAVAGIDDYKAGSADIGGVDHPERIRLLAVSSDYTTVLRARPVIGRSIEVTEEESAPVVVLSYDLWQRAFDGKASAIGAQFLMSGNNYTVIGVMPKDFVDPFVKRVDAWIPLNLAPGRDIGNAQNHYFTVLARLRAGVTLSRAQQELDKLSIVLGEKYVNQNAQDTRASLEPLKEDIVAPASRSLTLMLGAVVLVLLLVCVNIANLLLVRGSERAREFALRTALGGQRSRLVRQLLVESLTLAIAGALVGLVVARLAMSAIVNLGSGAIPRLSTLTLDPRLLFLAIGIATVCSIVFGLVPALRTTRSQPGDVLRDASRSATGSRSQGRVREALVVAQVALAFVMLIGASLLLTSFRKLQQVDLGVLTTNVLTFGLQLPSARYDSTARALFYENVATQIEKLPSVVAVGGVSKLPATGDFNQWGSRPLTGPMATAKNINMITPQQRFISGDYFRAVGIHLLQGRIFNGSDDNSAPKRIVISQTIADKYFPGVSVIGQHITTGDGEHEVIGVVNEVSAGAEGDLAPTMYHAHRQSAGGRNWALDQVVLASSEPTTLVNPIRKTINELDAALVMYQPQPLANAIGKGIATRVFTMRLLTAFATVALLLAALGLYGVLSYAVKLRTREFGIRMALGANRGSIRNLVMARGVALAAIGVAVGFIGAIAMSRVMTSLVFQVSPLDPVVLAGATLFMGVIATVAAFVPAYRATGVDPRQALAAE